MKTNSPVIIQTNTIQLPQISIHSLNNINFLILVINCYVFFYQTQHQFILSVFSYINGMMFIGSHIQFPQNLVTKTQKTVFYTVNFLIWGCQHKGITINEELQIQIIVVILGFCFLKPIYYYLKVLIQAFSFQKPSFRQIYISSQLLALRNVIIDSLSILTEVDQQSLSIIGVLILSHHIFQLMKIGQFRHILSSISLFCGILCYFFAKYQTMWIFLTSIRLILLVQNDIINIWDIQRLRKGARTYSLKFYFITGILNFIGRLTWLYRLYYGETLYCKTAVLFYRKIIWNLVRLDRFNFKSGAPNQKLFTQYQKSKFQKY